MKREALLWIIFVACLSGSIFAGLERETAQAQGPVSAWPFQGLSLALGIVSAASLVMACLEVRGRR